MPEYSVRLIVDVHIIARDEDKAQEKADVLLEKLTSGKALGVDIESTEYEIEEC